MTVIYRHVNRSYLLTYLVIGQYLLLIVSRCRCEAVVDLKSPSQPHYMHDIELCVTTADAADDDSRSP